MIAERNAETWSYLDNQLQPQITKFDDYTNKVTGSPYSETQKESIANYGLNTNLFINTYSFIIDSLVGMAYGSKNGLTTIGDPKTAFMWQVVLTGMLQRDKWLTKWLNILHNKYTKGLGIICVDKDDDPMNPYGCTIKSLDPRWCRWSMTGTDVYWEDMDMFAYCDIMSVKQAIIHTGKEYSDDMEDVTMATTLPASLSKSWSMSDVLGYSGAVENRLVPYLEVYTKEYKNYIRLLKYNKDRSAIIYQKDVESNGSVDDSMMSFFTTKGVNKDDALKYIAEVKELGSLEELKLQRVIKQVSVGGLDIGKYELPTRHYPFIPVPYKIKNNREYIGVIENIDGLATTINHTVLIQLISGWTSCGIKVLLPGTGSDVEEMAKKLSVPNAVVPYEVHELGNGSALPPNVITIPNIGQSFNDLMLRLIDYMQMSTNVNDVLQGSYPGLTPPSGQAVGQLRDAGSRTFKPYQDIDAYALAQMGRVLVDYIRAYSQKDKMIRILTEDETVLDGISNYGVDARVVNMPGYNVEMPINKTVQDDENISIVNDLRNGDPDIEFSVVSAYHDDSAKNQWVMLMNETIRQAPDTVRVLLGRMLKLMNFPQAVQVGKDLDDREQLVAQNESLQTEVKALKREVKLYMEQNFRARSSAELAQFKGTLETLYNELDLMVEKVKAGDISQADQTKQKIEQAINSVDTTLAKEQSTEQFIESNTPKG